MILGVKNTLFPKKWSLNMQNFKKNKKKPRSAFALLGFCLELTQA